MKYKTKNWMILIIVISIALYLGFIIFSNLDEVVVSFQQFNWKFFPTILSLVFAAFLLRATRWDYYLRKININLSRKYSYLVFFAGLSMGITPGKIGELIKPYILKDRNGLRLSATIPVVFIERFTDLIGMTMLASIGLLIFRYGKEILLLVVIFLAMTVIIIQNKSMCLTIIRKLEDIPWIDRYIGSFEQAYKSGYYLLRPKPLGTAIIISFCAWGLECLCLYLIFIGLDVKIGVLESIFIFAFSSIVGAFTMLPGGLGVTEGIMVGLAVMGGVELSKATASTLLIRFSTLWFGAIIGLFILQYLSECPYPSARAQSGAK